MPNYYSLNGKFRRPCVFFIGNSFTFFHDLPSQVASFSLADDRAVRVDAVLQGGYHLDQYLDMNDPYGEDVSIRLKHLRYEYIVAQEQSFCPISDPDRFDAAIGRLDAIARERGAELALFETWGYHDLHRQTPLFGGSSIAMEEKLRDKTSSVAEKYGRKWLPVGYAFSECQKKNPGIYLFDPDRKHPGVCGTYLGAAVIYGGLFGRDPEKISFDGGISPSVAEKLRSVAKETLVLTGLLPGEEG